MSGVAGLKSRECYREILSGVDVSIPGSGLGTAGASLLGDLEAEMAFAFLQPLPTPAPGALVEAVIRHGGTVGLDRFLVRSGADSFDLAVERAFECPTARPRLSAAMVPTHDSVRVLIGFGRRAVSTETHSEEWALCPTVALPGNRAPQYPEAMRRAGKEGEVLVPLEVVRLSSGAQRRRLKQRVQQPFTFMLAAPDTATRSPRVRRSVLSPAGNIRR